MVLSTCRLHRNSSSFCRVKGRYIGLVLYDNSCDVLCGNCLSDSLCQLFRKTDAVIRGKYSLQELRENFLLLPTVFEDDSRETISFLSFRL